MGRTGGRVTRRRAVVALTAAAVLVAAFVVWDRRAGSAALGEYRYRVESTPVAVGQTLWVDVYTHAVDAPERTVTVTGVTPQIQQAPEDTAFDYVVCLGGSVGVLRGRNAPQRNCDEVVPAVGSSVTFGGEREASLLVGITSPTSGRLAISSYRIDHTEGSRSGSTESAVTTVVPFGD